MKKYEKVLKALANSRRLTIIKYLKKEKESTVGNISTHLKLSFKATSKHLTLLLASDILTREQRSLEAFYSLHPNLPRLARAVLNLI